MPDQSLSNEPVSGNTDQTVGNPADTAANAGPAAATTESLESNVTRASDGEKQQADQTINGDPVASTGDVQTAGAVEQPTDDYDTVGYRALQKIAKDRQLDAGGKEDELIARLREYDAQALVNTGEKPEDVPTAEVDPAVVQNGGIQMTGRGQEHAEILQGLSAQRRQQQLDAIAEKSQQAGSDEE